MRSSTLLLSGRHGPPIPAPWPPRQQPKTVTCSSPKGIKGACGGRSALTGRRMVALEAGSRVRGSCTCRRIAAMAARSSLAATPHLATNVAAATTPPQSPPPPSWTAASRTSAAPATAARPRLSRPAQRPADPRLAVRRPRLVPHRVKPCRGLSSRRQGQWCSSAACSRHMPSPSRLRQCRRSEPRLAHLPDGRAS